MKPGRLHFLLLEWPHGVFEVHGLKSKVTKVYFLGNPQGKALPFEQQGENLKIILPEKQPDPLAPVLVAEIADQAPRTSFPSLKDQERQSATQTKGDLGAPSVK